MISPELPKAKRGAGVCGSFHQPFCFFMEDRKMIYEEIAQNIQKARNQEAHLDHIAGIELFEDWPADDFDVEISLAEKTGETRKAKAIKIIRDYCVTEQAD